MPIVKPVSELQRNLGTISAECHETKRPVYLTKNGTASLVVMDAKAFDERYAEFDSLLEHEEHVQRSIARGYDDLLNGRTRPWSSAKEDIARIRAARSAE